jgi:His-Xaa-Ser system protein HxsD
MIEADAADPRQDGEGIVISFSPDLISNEALLKTCYWFSRDFTCEVVAHDGTAAEVLIKPKPGCRIPLDGARDRFVEMAMDFALRERVTAQTSEVRDLLLAKAFSESGVLEDAPEGVFGDAIEESKPDGLFKILANQ